MAIGIGMHCWYCDHGPCTGDCKEESREQSKKVLEIESQIMMDTDIMLDMLKTILKLAKEAGYTHVKDNWGPGAFDEYTIDEAIEKFNIKFPYPNNGELPF